MPSPPFSFIHVTDTHLREDLDVVTPFIETVNAERYHPAMGIPLCESLSGPD